VKLPKPPKPPPEPKVPKKPYTCKTDSKEIDIKEPLPVLDQEAKQIVGPDGKPLFYPPVKQLRDKKGYPVCGPAPDYKPIYQSKNDMGYDEHGKKIPVPKVKIAKTTPAEISRGVLTVDYMIGKAEMNYKIPDLKFIYIYSPGIGIAVISNSSFPGAVEQKNAFKDNSLVVKVDDHRLELSSDKQILGKKGKAESAFVLLDREHTLPSKYPVVGYGRLYVWPYEWPGSKPNAVLKNLVTVPPTPKTFRPIMLLAACPQGQMRRPLPDGYVALPGSPEADQPCVPIGTVMKKMSSSVADMGRASAPEAETAPADAAPGATPAPAAAPTATSTPAPSEPAEAPAAAAPASAPAATSAPADAAPATTAPATTEAAPAATTPASSDAAPASSATPTPAEAAPVTAAPATTEAAPVASAPTPDASSATAAPADATPATTAPATTEAATPAAAPIEAAPAAATPEPEAAPAPAATPAPADASPATTSPAPAETPAPTTTPAPNPQ
jgi:hypothetical protein